MQLDPIDKQTLWMHTGDEGIIDEEGYLRSAPFDMQLIVG
jgi:acyl-CoA synthetase (AMP-forming)/AMP-acid ligase II